MRAATGSSRAVPQRIRPLCQRLDRAYDEGGRTGRFELPAQPDRNRSPWETAIMAYSQPSPTTPTPDTYSVAGSGFLVGEPNPDAELIAKATAFLQAEQAVEKEASRFLDLPVPWTATDRREWRALDVESTRYHERLAEITCGEPCTPDGLVAQALVVLWHAQGEADPHAGKLAQSVLRIHGVPLPEWAIAT